MTRTLVLAGVLLIGRTSEALTDPAPRGARASALGGLSTGLSHDLWASTVNPALGFSVEGIAAAFEYVPAPWGLSELARAGAAVHVHLCGYALEASVIGSGSGLYGETVVAAGAALPAGSRASVGLSCSARHVRINSYGSATSFSLALGSIFSPVRGLDLGIAVSNLLATRLGASGERQELTLQAGICAEPVDQFRIGLDVWKSPRFPVELHAGVEITPLEHFAFRGGISQNPPGLAFGVGFCLGIWTIDYAAVFHPILGATHFFGVTLCIATR